MEAVNEAGLVAFNDVMCNMNMFSLPNVQNSHVLDIAG